MAAVPRAVGGARGGGSRLGAIGRRHGLRHRWSTSPARALPGANVQLIGPGANKFAVSGNDGRYTFTGVPAGTHKVTATLIGFSTETHDVVVARRRAPSRCRPRPSRSRCPARRSWSPPARRESSLVNAPATMSVVSNETIEASPAQNYGDLLRSVPGLNVIQMSARDINITSRQGTSTLSNSQLALLDGRSIYLDFFGLILWDFVPVQPVRHQADRGRARPRLGGVGRQRAHRRGEHHHQDAARGRRADSVTLSAAACSTARRTRRGLRAVGYGACGDLLARPRTTGGPTASPAATSTRTRTRARPARIPLDRPIPRGQHRASAPAAASTPTSQNQGTKQPKVDLRVDQELTSGGRITYRRGLRGDARASSTPASAPSTSRAARTWATAASASRKGGFTRRRLRQPRSTARRRTCWPGTRHGHAHPAQLQDPDLRLRGRATRTVVGEPAHPDATAATRAATTSTSRSRPQSEDRTEFGAYFQDEIFWDKFRLSLGGARGQVRQHRGPGLLAPRDRDLQARAGARASARRSTRRSARRRPSTTSWTSRSRSPST